MAIFKMVLILISPFSTHKKGENPQNKDNFNSW